MAGIDYTANIGPSIPFQFAREGVATWNEICPILSNADIEFEFTGSDQVSWSASYSGSAGGFVSEGSDVLISQELGSKDRTKAFLNRGIVRGGFGLTHTEMATVASLNPDITADFVVERLKDSWLETLSYLCRNQVEVACLVGTGTAQDNSTATPSNTNATFGIINAILTVHNGGSYANLTSAYGGWQPVVINCGGVPITQKVLDEAFTGLDNGAGIYPKFMMGSAASQAAVKENIGDAIIQQFSLEQAASYKLGMRSQPSSSMPPNLFFNGVPFHINSAFYQAGLDGYILLGRWEDLAINILPYPGSGWFDAVLSEKKNGISSYANIVKKLGLPFYTYSLYKSGASSKVVMELEYQLRIKALNRFALVYNFPTTD